jgi:hypothetical protein
MASLKELEEDLKRLIEERNGLQPNFNTTNSINTNDLNIRTYMAVEEHGQPFNKQSSYSRMAIREHGQPYKITIEEAAQNLLNECHTFMAVREHGQPYKQVWYDIEGNSHSSYESKLESDEMISDKKYDHIRRNGMCVTKMAVREHGRPYRNTSSEKTLSERVQSKINAVMGWK